MPVFWEEIKRYDASYMAGGKNTSGYTYKAIIGLRRDDNSLIGAAYFHHDPDTMPDSDDQSAPGYVYFHYPKEDYQKVLDLLRNESPVFVRYVGGDWKIATITTGMEPVGDGDLNEP